MNREELREQLDMWNTKGELIERILDTLETIEQIKSGTYMESTETTSVFYNYPQPCCTLRLDIIENILKVKHYEEYKMEIKAKEEQKKENQ